MSCLFFQGEKGEEMIVKPGIPKENEKLAADKRRELIEVLAEVDDGIAG